MANIVATYLCWFFGGIFGLHHVYLGRDKHAFVWWISLGGLGLGWFRDLWRIPEYLHEVNRDERFLAEFASRRQRLEKPPFSCVRFAGQILIGLSPNCTACGFLQFLAISRTIPRKEYHADTGSKVNLRCH